MTFTRRGWLAASALALLAGRTMATASDSVYQLPLSLTDQDGRGFSLDARRGKPLLVSMFYTSCEFVCPMLVETIRDAEAKLKPAEREKLTVLLVSFDPARDSVQVLKTTAHDRGLAAPHWTLARADEAAVRKLSAVLDIPFRRLPNGDYKHASTLVLLDAEGRIAARSSQMGKADPAFVKQLQAALR